MDELKVISADKPWWVHSDCAADVQALIGGGFKHLPVGRALFFAFSDVPPSGTWISNLSKVAPVTAASESATGQDKAIALGVTAAGLTRCGLSVEQIAAFGPQYSDGMTESSRARRLGDKSASQLLWSGNDSSQIQVHFVLLTYSVNNSALNDLCQEIVNVLAKSSISLCHQLNLEMKADGKRADGKHVYREHFGFADGISQPIPTDNDNDIPAFIHGTASAAKNNAKSKLYHQVSSGDFLFGRKNSYGELAPSPFLLDNDADELQKGNAPIGSKDFAYNGTFLVIRQLSQDVDGFNQHIRSVANEMEMTPDELAEKLVGRTKDGALLGRDRSDISNNRGFAEDDSDGYYCPLGSHVRRANPRDDGGHNEKARRNKLSAANNHRILRRGRNYTLDDEQANRYKQPNRGLLFMCINTDIRRQFEFIQTTWLNSRQFSSLNETDPLLGATGTSTIQSTPLRIKPTIQTFVELVGGDYFFMPSISALNYLSKLGTHVEHKQGDTT